MKRRHKLVTIPLLIVSTGLLILALALSHSEPCPAPQGAATGIASMKAVVHTCYGSPDVLQVVNVEVPVARPGEILVKVEAASAPVAGITALQALRDNGQLEAGQKVLINGASGGVGTFAVQIAKSMGAEVTGVCSTRNVEMVKSIGADHVVDYKRENYTDSGLQYDLIIDNVGNQSLSANRRALKPEGKLVLTM